jgi:hypothetical protein
MKLGRLKTKKNKELKIPIEKYKVKTIKEKKNKLLKNKGNKALMRLGRTTKIGFLLKLLTTIKKYTNN